MPTLRLPVEDSRVRGSVTIDVLVIEMVTDVNRCGLYTRAADCSHRYAPVKFDNTCTQNLHGGHEHHKAVCSKTRASSDVGTGMTTHLRLCHAGSVSPPGGNTLLALSEHISCPKRIGLFTALNLRRRRVKITGSSTIPYKFWSHVYAQYFPDNRQVHREPTISRLSVDTSYYSKELCFFIASYMTYLSIW
jgi:hypothetical protein